MAKQKTFAEFSSCKGKMKYKTMNQAIRAMLKTQKREIGRHKSNAYYCGFCGHYHWGRIWSKETMKALQ